MHNNNGDDMKFVKDMSLISLGVGGVLLYQKYSPMMLGMIKEKISCACEDIEDLTN